MGKYGIQLSSNKPEEEDETENNDDNDKDDSDDANEDEDGDDEDGNEDGMDRSNTIGMKWHSDNRRKWNAELFCWWCPLWSWFPMMIVMMVVMFMIIMFWEGTGHSRGSISNISLTTFNMCTYIIITILVTSIIIINIINISSFVDLKPFAIWSSTSRKLHNIRTAQIIGERRRFTLTKGIRFINLRQHGGQNGIVAAISCCFPANFLWQFSLTIFSGNFLGQFSLAIFFGNSLHFITEHFLWSALFLWRPGNCETDSFVKCKLLVLMKKQIPVWSLSFEIHIYVTKCDRILVLVLPVSLKFSPRYRPTHLSNPLDSLNGMHRLCNRQR